MSERRFANDLFIAALVLVTAGWLLARTLDAGFLTDDYEYLRLVNFGPRHAETWDPDRPTDALKVFHTRASTIFELYRPLVILSYAVQYRVCGGLEPRAYQVWNFCSHLLGGLMVFLLLRRLLPKAPSWSLGLGTFVWLVSPLQLEVVVWSATRSDGLSWLFGSLALWCKLGAPKRWWLPTLALTAALLCKEQAVFWVLAVGLVDLFPPVPTPWRDRILTALRRNAGMAIVVVGYLGMRMYLFDSSFQKNAYAEREFESFWSLALWASYARSLSRLIMPISIIAFSGWIAVALRTACALGMSVVALRGCRQLSARPVLRWLLPLLLFLGPFMLAVTMNEIGVDLVNSRAGYTPMFLVAALTAAAAASGRAGLVGAVLLSTSLAFASRPSQELYVRAHQDVEAALSAMRGSLRSTEVAPADDRAVILGYQELDHFRGSFDLSGAIVPALQRPYMDRDWQIARTASDEPQADHGHWTPFPALFRDASSAYVDRGDGIWMSLVSEGGGYRAPIVYAGAKAAANGGGLTLTWPEPGHVSPLEPSRPETLQPRYVVRTRGLESATLHLTMIAAGGREFGPLPLDASFVRSRALADGAVEHEVVLPPVSQAILEGLPSRKAYGFFFEARDAEHTVLARSPLRLFFTTRP